MNKNKAFHKKGLIVKNKVKNNNSSIENIKTESQGDLYKNISKEPKTKNIGQNSLYNLESSKPYDNEDIRGTLKQNNTKNIKKTNIVDNKEKKNVKNNNTKKDKQFAKTKKLVNFVNNLMKQQKSERKINKEKKAEDEIEVKLNKSVGVLNKNDISDDNYLEENALNIESNNINILKYDKNDQDNINIGKTYENNNEKRQPNIKVYRKGEELDKDEPKKDLKIQEEQNKMEINELQIDNSQNKKVEINDQVDNNIDNDNTKPPKKVYFNNDNENISPEKQMNREIIKDVNKDQNKKGNKIYLNFIQNIKKSSKNKKGNKLINILKTEDPKSTKTTKTKLSNAIKKINMINKTFKNKNLSKDLRQTMGIPFLQNLREEIMNEQNNQIDNKYDFNEQNKSHKNLLQDINIDDNNINTITTIKNDEDDENYTGLVLVKYNEGEKIKEIKLEGTIDKINYLLNKEKIAINNKEIALIDKNELERLRKENEKFQNQFFKLKEEYDKQRELLKKYNYNINDNVEYNDNLNNINNDNLKNNEDNNNNVNVNDNIDNNDINANEKDPFLTFKKKSMEEENNQMDEENLKIKEIKERIQKYKDELKKGSNLEPLNERMSYRVNYNKKESFNIDQKMKEFEKKREKMKKEEKKKQIENYENKVNNITSTNNNKNIEDINNSAVINYREKGDKKDNKEKDKNKGYSKALDRFKKRYKNHSTEIRSKKSERINEMAKNLENVIGKQQTTEITDNKNSSEIVNYPNSTEIIEKQTFTVNKTKKPKKPQL